MAEPVRHSRIRDDIAYLLPFVAFMAILQVGNSWKSLYIPAYVARTAIVPVLLYLFWRHYTKIR
jgi:hypothetical protein